MLINSEHIKFSWVLKVLVRILERHKIKKKKLHLKIRKKSFVLSVVTKIER